MLADKKLVTELLPIVRKAGEYAKNSFAQTEQSVYWKEDHTPVTAVDLYLSNFLTQQLQKLTPAIPVLSEEKLVNFAQRREWQTYWLIDPLDGTQQYIQQKPDFTIIVALIDNNKPILGLVYAPMTDIFYYAYLGGGSYKYHQQITTSLQTKVKQTDALDLLISSNTKQQTLQTCLDSQYNYQFITKGSCGLKCSLVAEGLYDGYFCSHPTGEWDIAAGALIISEAGGVVVDIHQQPLTYNQRETLINPPFIAVANTSLTNIII